MVSFIDTYFSYNPLLRGLVIAGLVYIGIEVIKPSFTHTEFEGQYYTKGWSRSVSQYFDEYGNDSGDLTIDGSWTPWYVIVILAFIIFGLFI